MPVLKKPGNIFGLEARSPRSALVPCSNRGLFFSSAVLDILIARARSHEALRFKVVGDLLAAVIMVAYLTSSVVWNFYPRSDLALVVLYLLRGLWDLRIWFEENYAP